jgi:hypothetical protein
MNNNANKQIGMTSGTIKKPITSNTNTIQKQNIKSNTVNKNNIKPPMDEYVDDRPAIASKKIEY